MKRTYFSTYMLGVLLAMMLPLAAKAIDLGVVYAVYATPEKPYVEVNVEIAALTITYKKVDSTLFEAGAEMTILLRQGDKVVNYEKYVMNSPKVSSPRALLDVKRLFVPNGDYILEVTAIDVNNPANKKTFSQALKVGIEPKIYLTEIELLRGFKQDASDNPFAKNGYLLEPLPFQFYDAGADRLAFYAEVYHSDKSVSDPTYLVRYFIEQDRGNGVKELVSSGAQRKNPKAIDALLVQMDISKMGSGNFILTVELRNKLNELLSLRTVPFQRSNPPLTAVDFSEEALAKQFVSDLSEENLRFSLRAISALAVGDQNEELKNILTGSDLKAMRYYLYRHFVNKNKVNPEQAYREYMEVAGAVHEKFKSGFRYGFETDRGRMFLRYGRPDDLIHEENDPNAPPYEIWVYYNFPKTNQKNVKFLFYNPSLAGEDFILLHSNARGEINNPRWERTLYSRTTGEEQFDGDNTNDALKMKRNFNRNARVYFEDF